MKRKLSEWISIHVAKKPGRVLLLGILLFNIVFLIISALVISSFSLSGTEKMSLFKAAFCTVTMILDPGCVQFAVEDIGKTGVVVAVTCLVIILIGMISFTGAVIGYITNYISNFIENANAGGRELKASNHFVILNWNTRASEIVNDHLNQFANHRCFFFREIRQLYCPYVGLSQQVIRAYSVQICQT